jgi:hypothetical protein
MLKSSNCVSFVILALLHVGCYSVEISVSALDDSGAPVEGAEVTLLYYGTRGPGEGWGHGKAQKVVVQSDASGLAKMAAPSFGMISVKKSGFYPSKIELDEAVYIFKASQEPGNHTEAVRLRKVVSPQPMYVRRVENVAIPSPEASYDLKIGDWVAPHGKGESRDLTIKVSRIVNGPKNYSYDLLITCSGGVLPMKIADMNKRSLFKFPYNAPENGYLNETKLSGFMQGIDGKRDIDGDRNAGYIFSLVRDVAGSDKNRMYGKIVGGIQYDPMDSMQDSNGVVSFVYYLNPQGPSLEWDTKNNLFPDVRINPDP